MQARAPAGAPPGLIAPDARAAHITRRRPAQSVRLTVSARPIVVLPAPIKPIRKILDVICIFSGELFCTMVFANSKSIYIICEDSCYLPTQHGARAVDL